MNLKFAVYGAVSLMAAGGFALDAESFAHPSAERHPETWFHLIGGNVAKGGLDADLDAVKAAGISGIQLFHGQFGGPWPGVSPQIPCLSADWDDLIRHAADGCAKRGLIFKMQNCPGWSMSGGPWITPDLAMRNLSYSRTVVSGPSSVTDASRVVPPIVLPVPDWQLENKLSGADLDYRDLFVLAFPTPKGGDQDVWVSKPAKADDKDGVLRRTFAFDAPKCVSAIELPSPSDMNHPNCYTPDARVQLFALDENGVRTCVLDQEVPQGVWQDRVPMTFACDTHTAKTWEFVFTHAHKMNIPQVKFHSAARLNNWEGLAGWVLRGLVKRPAPKQDAAAYVKADQVLDLTDKFKDGKLVWTPPAGSWTILRIGHVNNGSRNGPAPKEATGWECNKMDRHAIDVHFASYIGRLAKGPLAGGKLKGFVVDSWECRRQTWTASLEADFRAANGYDFRRKLPAVFGWVLDDPATTERFLLDWRRTLGELVEKNYYARMNELARAMGMTAQYETAFGDVLPGDLMSFWKWCDTPMCEFWHPRTTEFVGQDDFKPVYPCASATHVYGKTRCAAESFTSMNLKWNEKLRDLKRTGNHALARGVTHLVFHTYTHNPRTDWLPPGTSFGHIIGTPFVRGQTWWGAMKDFTDYFARCETLLEAGQPCSDVLWFLGDEVGHKPSEIPPKQLEGFKFDYCNPDALLMRVSAKNGQLVLPDGVSYSVLWVPEGTYVAPKSEAKLKELVAAGARIVRGTPDAAVAGLRPDVVAGPSARGAENQLEPPFEWIHRTARMGQTKEPIAARDWYFVSANGAEGYKGEVSFRAMGGVELWDPVTGARRPAKVVSASNGRTTLAFDFACGESAFVVFLAPDASRIDPPVTDASRVAPSATPLTHWTLCFPLGWGAPTSIPLPDLTSWTDLHLGDEARHFSGTASYYKTLSSATAVTAQLDLGRVESVATVFVNGVKVRTLWAPPYRCEIPLKAGANELRVDVTDTWFNRLAYDAGLPEKDRKTWTIAGPKKGTKSEPAGLLGPVMVWGADAGIPEPKVVYQAGADAQSYGITAETWRKGLPEWPSVNIPVPKALSDFRPYDRIAVDFVNEAADPQDTLSNFISGAEGHVANGLYHGGGVLPDRGYGRWIITLKDWSAAKKVNPSDIARVHFFLTHPNAVKIRFLRVVLLPRGVNWKCPELPESLLEREVRPLVRRHFAEDQVQLTSKLETSADVLAAQRLLETIKQERKRAAETAKFRAACEAAGQKGAFYLGTATSMDKIRPRDGATPAAATALSVRLARGEREAVQLFVMPRAGALKNVRVAVSPLMGVNGNVFAATNVKVCALGYVNVTNRPPYTCGENVATNSAVGYVRERRKVSTGWWPDPILDFLDHADVVAGDMQGFWLRVTAPEGQAAGIYRGTVTVSADGAASVVLPFSVRVNDFTLPRASMLPLAITFGPGPTRQWEGPEGLALADARQRDPLSPVNQWRKHRTAWCDFLADYFLSYDSLYHSGMPDFEMLMRNKAQGRLGWFNLGYWGVPGKGEEGKAAWRRNTLARLKKAYERAKALGIADRAYIYGCDEAEKDAFERIQWAAAEIRRELPGVPLSTTAYDTDYGVGSPLGVIDWFTPQTPVYDRAKADRSRAAGHQVWWYFACSQHAPCANSFIECQGIEMRSLMGAQAVKARPDGFLYYQTTIWNSIRPIEFGPFTDWDPRSWTMYHGDGSWTCCGPDGTPLATVRLENFRDGLEDYAYAKILESKLAANPSATWAAQARELLAVPDTLVENVKNYSDSPSALYAWRDAMADMIESVSRR